MGPQSPDESVSDDFLFASQKAARSNIRTVSDSDDTTSSSESLASSSQYGDTDLSDSSIGGLDSLASCSQYGETDPTILNQCIHWLLERAADKHKESTAVICGQVSLTYGELHVRADRFACHLIERGVKKADRVGIALDRSANLVVALIAVLKSGAAYIPIDPTLPLARIRQILDGAAPRFVVVDADRSQGFTDSLCELVKFDEQIEQPISSANDSNCYPDVGPDDLAYIMYTSGSTGVPKGVEISHGAASNFLSAMQRTPGVSNTDRGLAISTIAFDMALFELFSPLVSGATLVVAQTDQCKDPQALLRLMVRHRITMMLATPTTWQMLLDYGWRGKPRLKHIMTGGEGLGRLLADRLLDCGDMVWNKYGPTETTACASIWRVCRNEPILIGEPVTNVSLYVLDAGLNPVPVGTEGELFIGGAGVAEGYHQNEERTRSSFLTNPFHQGRIYRTGDAACYLSPKQLCVMGRIDDQVKIRGNRIELGDIESAIAAHPSVSSSVVISRAGRLLAYCIRKSSTCTIEADHASMDTLLRPWLAGRLPGYMMPAFITEIDIFPLTFNGKVDRKALPDPVRSPVKPIERPINDLQRDILGVWSFVLDRADIGIHDNFFDIGGDSATLVRVQVGLQKALKRDISVAKLFQFYTIETLAKYLTADSNANRVTSEGVTSKGISRERVPDSLEDIAIVSMSCRLPGGIENPAEFWTLLETGADAVDFVPKDRWDADAFYDPNPGTPGKSQCRYGGFLASKAIETFDASFFNMSLREAQQIDSSQRIMLETSWDAFEMAGCTREQLNGSSTGVFIGISNVPAHHDCDNTPDLTEFQAYAGTGSAGATTSGRISYVFGLEGPCLTVDTACSSSLVSTHLACAALRRGECDMAVSGGVALLPTPALHVEFSQLGGLAQDGRCRSFSEDACGTGFAEGAAAVVLKRLSDAQRDGDQIHAVLRGTAVNHGGRAASLTTPNAAAQHKLIRTALSLSSLDPTDIDYIEAHGTGTSLGDPIEGQALSDIFGGKGRIVQDPLLIGSVKSNLGHTQAAAGLVGLLKVVLALRHRSLPRTLHAKIPTSAINWIDANMTLVQKNRPWTPKGSRKRRAGVSAFGIGGTNAHVIVEEMPEPDVHHANSDQSKCIHRTQWNSILPIMLSGLSLKALQDQVMKLLLHLERSSHGLIDIAYTLAVKRSHYQYRQGFLARDNDDLTVKLRNFSNSMSARQARKSNAAPRLAMLFTGQGGQLLNAGKQLALQHPVFKRALEDVASGFEGLLEHSLLEVMWAADDTKLAALLRQTNYSQPALFTVQVALWRWWNNLGVRADIVLGHSVGEIAAAHVAGVMSLLDASRFVAIRGQLMQEIPLEGTMTSIEASEADVVAMIQNMGLENEVDIAACNTPKQTVISGNRNAVEQLTPVLHQLGCKFTKLSTSRAFHSHHVDKVLDRLLAAAETIRFSPPTIAVVSGLTGQLAQDGHLQQAVYWANQARGIVRFKDGIETLSQQNVNAFLELGPQPTLCGLGATCLADQEPDSMLWCPSLDHKHDDTFVAHTSLARLHEINIQIDWPRFFETQDCKIVDLPTYAFQRQALRKISGKKRTRKETPTVSQAKVSATGKATNEQLSLLKVNWQRLNARKHALVSGNWGLLCVGSDPAFTAKLVLTLKNTKLNVTCISNLRDGQHMDGIICFWQPCSMDPFNSCTITEAAVSQLQYAAQHQIRQPLVWATEDVIDTGMEGSHHDSSHKLTTAPLWGLMRTARAEHPELQLRLIGIAESMSIASWGKAVEALSLSAEPEVILKQENIHIPRMIQADQISKVVDSPLVRTDGAVLITGGFGGLGQSLARWLVANHGVRDLVLTSRRGAETREAQVLIDELTRRDVRVEAVAGDISDLNHVQSLLDRFDMHRPLRGVIHAAGVPSTGVLASLKPRSCGPIFASKVTGTWNLHQLTQKLDLDFFVLCSSISGVMGAQGLGAYAAANSFLDTLAAVRGAAGLPASSVAFGPFEGGMASDLIRERRAGWAQAGLGVLNSEQVLNALERSIRSKRTLTIAKNLNLERMQEYHKLQGQIPALLRSLLTASDDQLVWSNQKSLHDQLAHAPPASHPKMCLDIVAQVVAQTLGFAERDIDSDRLFRDMGLDSLTAPVMRNHLAKLTNLQLSVNVFFLHPTPAALARFMITRVMSDLPSETPSSMSTPQARQPQELLNTQAISRACLDAGFLFENVNPTLESPSPPKAVLVTGATGFVGAFLVYELLKRGVTAHCIVRGTDNQKARQRLIKILILYGLWKAEYDLMLVVIVGDMALYQFGLTNDRFLSLANEIDTICHASGLVDWLRPYDDYVGPNIISTHEVLRLANTGRCKTVHHISTVATLPMHTGLGLSDEDPEYNYATSKWMSERLIDAARWRGAKASVYRLPFVAAATSNGQFRQDVGDFLHNMIVSSIEIGLFPHIEADLSLILPVDYLCQSVVDVATQAPNRIGQDFDFKHGRPLSFDSFFDLFTSETKSSIVPFSIWRKQVLSHGKANPGSVLARIAPVVDGCTDKEAAGMFKALPPGRHVLGGKDYPAPSMDQDFVSKYCRRIGSHRILRSHAS